MMPKKRTGRPNSDAVSLRDVARAANVSTATVSRALNNPPAVSPDLRKRILDIAQATGYTPHAAARALASQKTRIIGAVIPSLENLNFSIGVAALQKKLDEKGFTLLLACSNYSQAEELKQVRALVAQGISGLMLVGRTHASELFELLEARRIPFISGWTVDKDRPYVGFDNYEIGRKLVNHLADLGHRDFGVIAQNLGVSDRAADRVAGIRDALREHQLEFRQEYFIEAPHRTLEGQIAFRALMQREKKPTAVICGTDVLAIGALAEAKQMNLVLPRDISITGINDIEFSRFTSPPLTTVALPVEEIGSRAADYLIGCLESRTVPSQTLIPAELIVRESSGPAPAASQQPKT